jgi:hypothetical protein
MSFRGPLEVSGVCGWPVHLVFSFNRQPFKDRYSSPIQRCPC